MAKKIAFEVTAGVSQATVKGVIQEIEEYLQDQYDLKLKLKDNPDVMALIQKGMKEKLEDEASYAYAFDLIDDVSISKLFKEEIKIAEAKLREKRMAEEEKRNAERIATSGLLRMNPQDLSKALKLLREAGIEAVSGH